MFKFTKIILGSILSFAFTANAVKTATFKVEQFTHVQLAAVTANVTVGKEDLANAVSNDKNLVLKDHVFQACVLTNDPDNKIFATVTAESKFFEGREIYLSSNDGTRKIRVEVRFARKKQAPEEAMRMYHNKRTTLHNYSTNIAPKNNNIKNCGNEGENAIYAYLTIPKSELKNAKSGKYQLKLSMAFDNHGG
jgi:hypothetical protein